MNTILIAIGRVEKDILDALQTGISKTFHCPVFLGQEMPEPDYAFNKSRKQYLATTIVRALQEQGEYHDADRILGVIDHDLYVPELNFVFGLASGIAAIIALARLRQEFYGLPKDLRLFEKRVVTEAVHELGHTYGMTHCENPQCVMFFSNTLNDTDRKSSGFCFRCRRALP